MEKSDEKPPMNKFKLKFFQYFVSKYEQFKFSKNHKKFTLVRSSTSAIAPQSELMFHAKQQEYKTRGSDWCWHL